MRVLVSGATGFVGKRLVARLLDEGHEVFALSRRSTPALTALGAHVIVRDLSCALDLDPRLLPVECIIHLAQAKGLDAADPSTLFRINLGSTVDLLCFGARVGIQKFVFASSGDVYESTVGKYSEESPLRPAGAYGKSKLSAELACEGFSSRFDVAILRLFHPYGPGQDDRLIPKLAAKIARGDPVTFTQGGHPFVTPIYIDDAVQCFLRVLEASPRYAVINVAGGECISLPELARKIGAILGLTPRVEERQGPAVDLAGDNCRMCELLGTRPRISLDEGLRTALLHETIRG